MDGRGEVALREELRGGCLDLAAWCGAVRLATVVVESTAPVFACRVGVDAPGALDTALAASLVSAVAARAAAAGCTSAELDVNDLVVRDAVRRAGFEGPLRTPLHGRAGPAAARSTGGGSLPDAVAALVPDVRVALNRSRLRRVLRSTMFGLGPSRELEVTLAPGRRPLRVVTPDDPDLLAEGVALAVDTARDVDARFAPWSEHIRVLSFDYSDHGMRTGRLGGLAQQQAAIVHLNASYVLPEALQRLREDRAGEPHPSTWGPRRATTIDAVTAHELWHHIEFAFETRDYRTSMAFRRRLGAHLGVETLEHAVRGGDERAPVEWRAAHARLVAEVSAYATKNVREATAEMFLQAWCYPVRSPVVDDFARTVDEFLPAPPGTWQLSTPRGT
ncbi:MAG TPA: hypothetical protein VHN98_11440 [Acidimicrobiales bacterium]|nr:hypothetical protein [Acidimicrobiales bacterium]